MNCPCGSDLQYNDCCLPVIQGERTPATAEELMRARYTAYTQVEMHGLYPGGDGFPEELRASGFPSG